MTDVVDIFNMTLDMLDTTARIETRTENTKNALKLNRNYDQCRDETLESHPWNFAITRTTLAAMSTNPLFGWDHQYVLPSDCIRVLPLNDDGYFEDDPVLFEVESYKDPVTEARTKVLLTNEDAPLKVRYIARVTDPVQFSPLFVRALCAKLAMYCGHSITGKTSYVDRAEKIFSTIIKEARMMDSLVGTPEGPDDDDWITARQSEYAG